MTKNYVPASTIWECNLCGKVGHQEHKPRGWRRLHLTRQRAGKGKPISWDLCGSCGESVEECLRQFSLKKRNTHKPQLVSE